MLLLDKIVPLFAYPLGFAVVVMTAVLLSQRVQARRGAKLIAVLTLIYLWLASMPYIANLVVRSIEQKYAVRTLSDVDRAAAIVVLGGIVGNFASTKTPPDLGDAVDRLFAGLRLYTAGKAPIIVLSGGSLPWMSGPSEAVVLKALMVELGVPADAIVLENASANTRENAINTAAIFAQKGWRDGILVTSAAHMARAAASFRAVGLDLASFPTDFRGRSNGLESVLDLMPDARALAATTDVIKEWLGLTVYRLRGWAAPGGEGSC